MKTLLFILCLGSSISIQANTMNRFEGEENVEESHDWEMKRTAPYRSTSLLEQKETCSYFLQTSK